MCYIFIISACKDTTIVLNDQKDWLFFYIQKCQERETLAE